jgi:hypothetical protein
MGNGQEEFLKRNKKKILQKYAHLDLRHYSHFHTWSSRKLDILSLTKPSWIFILQSMELLIAGSRHVHLHGHK